MELNYWRARGPPYHSKKTLLAGAVSEHPFVFVGSFIVVISTLYIFYCRSWSPLARIPGPFSASLSRLWLVQHSRAGDMHRTMIDLHKKYGQVVRIAPNEISVTNPEVIKRIYGPGTKFRKSSWYSVFQGRRKFDLFAERNEAIHGQQRRLVSRIYSAESLKDYEPYVGYAVSQFMVNMEKLQGSVIDMGKWLQLFAFDVIGQVTFSRPFGFMETQDDDGIFEQIISVLHSGAWLGQVPWLYQICTFLQPVTGNWLGINARHGKIREYALQAINERKKRDVGRQDILSKLFEVQKAKSSEMDIADVISMAASNINAGSDTTAISMRAVIYYLVQNSHCREKLQAEIDSIMSVESPSAVVTLEQSNKMPYLQACMYEALRLHPAVGMSLPRTTPSGGITIGSFFVPEKTIVGANPWAVHYSKDVYGEDADLFRPGRWLEDETGDLHRSFFAFGSGARTCLGRNISWMEMSKLIPTLFHRYHVQLVDPGATLHESCNFFVMQSGLKVTLSPRRPN